MRRRSLPCLAANSRPCARISSTTGSLRIIFTHELFRPAQHRAHQARIGRHADHHGRHSWSSPPCNRISVFTSPLPVRDRLPMISRGRSLLEFVALAQPASGSSTPSDFSALAESTGLLVAGTGSIHAGVHKQVVGAPYSQGTLSFSRGSAHQYHSLPAQRVASAAQPLPRPLHALVKLSVTATAPFSKQSSRPRQASASWHTTSMLCPSGSRTKAA